ncbi:MAG: CHAT domain-containing protein [bacterium]
MDEATILEITIQHKAGERWPVVVEQSRPERLPVRSEGALVLEPESFDELTALSLEPARYGELLGRALFRDAVRDALMQARRDDGGRVRLLLVVEDPQLKTLQWRRLCAPIRSAAKWDFLALDQRILFSLYVPCYTDRHFPRIGTRDLRALLLIANPPEANRYRLTSFDPEQTVRELRRALGEIPVDVLGNVPHATGQPTLNDLCERITDNTYTLLHLVAHGSYGADGETIVYLLDALGDVAPVAASELLRRLDQLQGARGLPHCAFLATCEGAAPEAEVGLGSLAQRLVRDLGLPAVVAMTDQVSTTTAFALAEQFYRRLRTHGEVDLALVQACASLADAGDVLVPALYTRLVTRALFSDTDLRPLTDSEVEAGLAHMEALLPQRAPVLAPDLERAAGTLRATLGTSADALSETARSERETALLEVGGICEKALDLDFDALARGQQPPAYEAICPFPGLAAFRPEDERFFYGREALVQELLARLRTYPFLALLGPSGCGKSSLVLAGLIPALRRQTPGLCWQTMTPGEQPSARLETALAALDGDGPALLVVDQFEELFTQARAERREPFLKQLLAAPQNVQVVLTMRADYWGECASHPRLAQLMQAHQLLVGRMSSAELRSAMEQQARAVGLRFDADLSYTIIDDIRDEPGAMPFLQHTLYELWQRRHGRWLRASEYRRLGGARQAIAHTADTVYGQLNDRQRRHMQVIFLRLTRLGEDDDRREMPRDTARRVKLEELFPAGEDERSIRALVDRLDKARLLVVEVAAHGKEWVEVSHEALIRHWPRLRKWLEEDRHGLRLHHQLREATQTWLDLDRDRGTLWGGQRLAQIQKWTAVNPGRLNEDEEAFLTASVQAAAAEARLKRTVRTIRAILIGQYGGAVGFAAAFFLTFWAQITEFDLLLYTSALRTIPGAIAGGLLTAGLERVRARPSQSNAWQSYAQAAAAGAIAFALGMLIHRWLRVEAQTGELARAAAEGMLWGGLAGAGLLHIFRSGRPLWQLVPPFVLAGALAFWLAESLGGAFEEAPVPSVLAAGGVLSLAIVSALLLARETAEEEPHET